MANEDASPGEAIVQTIADRCRAALLALSTEFGPPLASMGMLITASEGVASAIGPTQTADLLEKLAQDWRAEAGDRKPTDATEH